MKITESSSQSVYIEIGNKTFYIDDSTDESIMISWITEGPPKNPEAVYQNIGWVNWSDFLGTA